MNNIKSPDLCDRCRYGLMHCVNDKTMSCDTCPVYVDGKCKCNEIKDNTPCEFFVERDSGKK